MDISRRYDFDWLRVLAVINVFIFHCIHFFDTIPWHVKNNEQIKMLDAVTGFIWLWLMPVIFLTAGLSSWYSLEKRSPREYLINRIKRLIVPLVIAGFLIILPIIFYFRQQANNGFDGTYIDAFIMYFRGIKIDFSTGPFVFNLLYAHLYFLIFLFFISVVTLPLQLYLKSEKSKQVRSLVYRIFSKPGGIYIFILPVIVVKIALAGLFTERQSWASFFVYLLYFLIGFIIASDDRLLERIKKHWIASHFIGMLGFAVMGLFIEVLGYDYQQNDTVNTWMFCPYQIGITIGEYGLVMFFTGLAIKFLKFNSKFLTYSNEAVISFYIIHQVILLAAGMVIRNWNMAVPPKFIILTLFSFSATILLYELCIRRFNPVRFIFGMPPWIKKKL